MYILSSKVCGEVEFALILRAHDPLLLVVAHQLVFPSKEMFSMKLKGFFKLYTFSQLNFLKRPKEL